MSATSAEFKNYLPFGRHLLPIDTATELFIHPRKSLQGSQEYELTIRFSTFRKETPVGYGDFILKVNTLEKMEALIERLRGHNLKWQMCIDSIDHSLSERKIDLIFNPKLRVGVKPNDEIIHWGELFLMFQKALGFSSPDYEASLVPIREDEAALRLIFKDIPNLSSKMEAVLDRICNQEPLRAPEIGKDVEFNVPDPVGSPNFIPSSYMEINNLSPLFIVTEERIEAKNRIGNDPSIWTENDIPSLIKGHAFKHRDDDLKYTRGPLPE